MRLVRLDSSKTTKTVTEVANIGIPWWRNTIYIDGKSNSSCSVLNNDNGTYLRSTRNCSSSEFYFMCEFLNSERKFEPRSFDFYQFLFLIADPPMLPIRAPLICSETISLNSTSRYLTSICVIRQSRNYIDSRLTCNNNGMQLFDIYGWTNTVQRSELFKYANSKWLAGSGNVFFVKGRKDGKCVNVNNVGGNFTEGTSNCSDLRWSFCQFTLAV
jgi:hypothetical protein